MKQMNPDEKIQLETWYLQDHKTLAEIGTIMGVSRQAVHARMRRHHIDTSRGERVLANCYSCGQAISVTRKRFLATAKHFCNAAHYTAYLRTPEFKQLMADKRLARIAREEEQGIRPRTIERREE